MFSKAFALVSLKIVSWVIFYFLVAIYDTGLFVNSKC